eukprot:TRINITY_DN2811_c0_g1_i1.p1 TRINITY_DN2811_c0_g1~~TRINITY_DN2811_c0_g1_i1.p1  ORF type:complete len:226 (+),score=71.47 TRINITY_DN2811_c0_g1_i1:959-1636(+)
MIVAIMSDAIVMEPSFVVHKDIMGRDIREEIQVATGPSRDIVAYASRLFGNMACDDDHRDHIAQVAAPAIKAALDLIQDDGAVAYYACAAMYNFIFRSREGHETVLNAGALDTVAALLASDAVQEDAKVAAMVERAFAALQPNGWRGPSVGDETDGGETASNDEKIGSEERNGSADRPGAEKEDDFISGAGGVFGSGGGGGNGVAPSAGPPFLSRARPVSRTMEL